MPPRPTAKRSVPFAILLAILPNPAFAQLDKIIGGIGKVAGGPKTPGSTSDSRLAEGLKEALTIGTTNAVRLTGATDGYFKNELIKIAMPPKLRTAEKGVRMVGGGPQVDAFVLGMNRAAEKAAPEASKYFKDAIVGMTFSDARAILTGGDTAATDYFRSKTSAQLTTAFRPNVEAAMAQVQVAQRLESVMSSVKKVPFLKAETFDLNEYVVQQAVAGIFVMVGQEEKKIRKDPGAQVTGLLREVFGHR